MEKQYTSVLKDESDLALFGKHFKRSSFLRCLKLSIRRIILLFLSRMMHVGVESLPNLYAMKKILLVSVNQRLGNTILVTPAVSALIKALPNVQFSFVGGMHAKSILDGYAIKQIHTIKRIDTVLPQRLWRLITILRKEKYDAAIHLSTATNSLGAYITYASGTRHRIGCRRNDGNILFTSVFKHPQSRHKVDQIRECMQQIGIPAFDELKIILKPEEHLRAEDFFRAHFGDSFKKPIGIFTGGRQKKGKAWNLESFGIIAENLRTRHIPMVIFIGPEELGNEKYIRSVIGPALYIKNATLREVAALVSKCKVIVTPDSGPMHLAVAVGVKTIALFSKPNFDRWGPREPYGKVIFDKSKTNTKEILNVLLEYYA
ncbi:glycosyltransferase family 9 protein [Candidatus Kuenenia sp.]|uniref:glycosyltransferase family 9 protein n=1 Tax=Candidatus Kuenenia sp. TaxID=2499824 RepID=UPI0032207540